jgi:hypothetical protein
VGLHGPRDLVPLRVHDHLHPQAAAPSVQKAPS